MALTHFVHRKRVLGFYFFDLTRDGFVRLEDFQLLGKTIATKMNLKAGSEGYQKLVKGCEDYWHAFGLTGDANNDGAVTCDEFLAAIGFVIELPNGKQILEKLNNAFFDALDLNGNGIISEDEYIICTSAAGVSTETARRAFRKLDLNGNGTMSRDEQAECIWEYWTSEDPKARGNWFFANN